MRKETNKDVTFYQKTRIHPYGVPRTMYLEIPDVAEIQQFGCKSSIGRLEGDEHGYTRSSEAKQTARRHYKKMARRQAKQYIQKEVSSFYEGEK